MKRAVLIYNPSSGRKRERRRQAVESAAAVLRAEGVEARLVETMAPGSAGAQALEVIESEAGCDAVFACGGDGTIHDVLQGMVRGAGGVPLGVVPLGTGNVLAYDLGLPHDAALAMRMQLSFTPRRVAAGKIEFSTRSGGRDFRYFCVTAGIGVDAEMLYHVTAEAKHRWGLLAYTLQMTRMALTHKFEMFEALWRMDPAQDFESLPVAQLLAVRLALFGPMLRHMAPDAALSRDDVQAILYGTRQPLRYLQQTLAAFFGKRWTVPGIEYRHAREILCRSLPDGKPDDHIYAEADGEVLGRLPVRITVIPQAFTLLMR